MMDEYNQMEILEQKIGTVKDFIEWLNLWLTDEEMELPLVINSMLFGDYSVQICNSYPVLDEHGDELERIKAVVIS